ncbi:MAG TPA: hypothetical protein VMW75_00880 [Thermoanaerobaculia bacterium]|nr:hypothetical protein [Thermoanaerobaculia bacterium]
MDFARLVPLLVGALLASAPVKAPSTPATGGPRTAAAPAPDASPAPPAAQDYKTFERKPTVLSDEELSRLRAVVLSRCGLAPATRPAEAPWYFHYELGLELERRGDQQRALDALLEAAARKARPARMSRMYGMWFRDYQPYFEIAKAHAALGNWQCAADALHTSEKTGEVGADDRAYFEFLELKAEVQAAQGRRKP